MARMRARSILITEMNSLPYGQMLYTLFSYMFEQFSLSAGSRYVSLLTCDS